MERAVPGTPCWTGPPLALGVLRAAPASRKSKRSTACQSMGWASPETAKGMVRSTLSAGSLGATVVKYDGRRTVLTVKGMSNVKKSGEQCGHADHGGGGQGDGAAMAVEPAVDGAW